MGFFIGPQDGVHTSLITLSLFAEPVQDVLVGKRNATCRMAKRGIWKAAAGCVR